MININNTKKLLTILAAASLATATHAATFEVYDVKISARTTTVKAMKLKDVSGASRTIHYRAPVTKAYTMVVAREKGANAGTFGGYGDWAGGAGDTVYGFMWSAADRFSSAFPTYGSGTVFW